MGGRWRANNQGFGTVGDFLTPPKTVFTPPQLFFYPLPNCFSPPSGRVLKCLKGFAGSVRGLQCHPSLPLVASCGLDRFLRVHDLGDKRLRHKVRPPPR